MVPEGGERRPGAPAARASRASPLAPGGGAWGCTFRAHAAGWGGRVGCQGEKPRTGCPPPEERVSPRAGEAVLPSGAAFSRSAPRGGDGGAPVPAADAVLGAQLLLPLTQMKCLYPPRLNSDPGRGTKMSSSPQIHTNPRKVAHKSSFYKRLTINLEASGLGGGAAVGETCDQQGPGRGQGGELSAVSCWPLSCPPVDRECLGPNQTLGRILGCLSRDRSSLESAPSSTPSGCLCPTQGGHSRPGVLDEAVPVGRPSTGPCGPLLPLSPHEVPVHFRSCQVSVFSFWGRGAPGRPQPGSRPRTAGHSRARPTVGLQHTDR